MNNTFRVISNLVSAAESVIAGNDDYEYIYDPDHKKHPGGGYTKTESGWQKGKKEKDEHGEKHSEQLITDEEFENLASKSSLNAKQEQALYEKFVFDFEKFYNNPEYPHSVAMLGSIAENPHTSAKILDKLSTFKNDKVDELGNDEFYFVRQSVSENKNTMPSTLDYLSNDSNSEIRFYVALHHNTSLETLEKLSKDEYSNVSDKAKESLERKHKNDKKEQPAESTEYKIKTSLSKFSKEQKQKMSGDSECPDKILNHLVDENDDLTNESIAKNQNSSGKTLNKLYNSVKDHKNVSGQKTMKSIAKHPHVTVETLDDMVTNQSEDIAKAIVENQNIHPVILDSIHDKYKNDNDLTEKIYNHKKATSLLKQSIEKEWDLNKKVDTNTQAKTSKDPEVLNKISESVTADDDLTVGTLLKNENLPTQGVFNIAGKYDSTCPFADAIVNHKNMSKQDIEKLFDETSSLDIKGAICYSNKTDKAFLKKQVDNYQGEDDALGKIAFHTLQSRNTESLPKFKFKGDDKTAPIIRSKFEKEQDEDETNAVYGEMAKFSRDDVAPMGVYHGRSKEQLKADFIKNMNPANYSSPEAYKNAKERVSKLSPQDFSRMLASIFADEDEEE